MSTHQNSIAPSRYTGLVAWTQDDCAIWKGITQRLLKQATSFRVAQIRNAYLRSDRDDAQAIRSLMGLMRTIKPNAALAHDLLAWAESDLDEQWLLANFV